MSNVFMQVNFRSQVLSMADSMDVILPDDRIEGEFPVLWLLHGGGGNEGDWIENTSIRRYADKHNLAVVMPHAGYSRYCNMYWGFDYFDFLTQELPKIVKHMFPRVSQKREDNFIAGLSLGGSGAISLGMRKPELYGAIGVLSASSIIPLEHLRPKSAGGPAAPGGPGRMSVNMINFGVENTDELKGNPEHDVLLNAENIINEKKPVPKVFHAVGMEDHAYPVGLGLKQFFEGFLGNPFRYEFHTEHGTHSWEFWDKWIQVFLDAAMNDRRDQYGAY
jgi:putative tributyrin esterase